MGNQVEQGVFSPFLQRARIAASRPHITGHILDIGCGNGAIAAHVQPHLYLGIDRDQDALAAAKAAFPAHRFEATLPTDGTFDTVLALAVIEHLKHPRAALESWSALLADRGRIVLTTPHRSFRIVHDAGSWLGLFSREAADEHEEMFDRELLSAVAEESGLRVAHYRRFLGGANQLFVLERDKDG
jgi:2-polyprenyl-3-methyl-5-hydroxy-6-metoxy-1,4-benzoquinol methylase